MDLENEKRLLEQRAREEKVRQEKQAEMLEKQRKREAELEEKARKEKEEAGRPPAAPAATPSSTKGAYVPKFMRAGTGAPPPSVSPLDRLSAFFYLQCSNACMFFSSLAFCQHHETCVMYMRSC